MFDPQQPAQETPLPGGVYLVEFSPYIPAAGVPGAGKDWENVPVELTFSGAYDKQKHQTSATVRAVAEERIRVPAGTFNTVRVEVETRKMNLSWKSTWLVLTYWYSPERRRTVKISWRLYSTYAIDNTEDMLELVSFQPGK